MSDISLYCFLFLCVCLLACNDPENPQPNIILIMADDLGYETIAANGGTSYQTPHIDQIAREGARFEHCYAQPLCTPSRVQIMTGIYNVRNYVRFGLLDTSQTTFGHIFKEAGYRTCIIGKWQLGADSLSPYWAGFDEYALWQVTPGARDSTGRDHRYSKPMIRKNGIRKRYSIEEYGPDVVRRFGMDFIDRSVQEEKPFLLYYPMILTHCPFSPTPDSPEWLTDDTTVMRYKGQAHYFEDMVAYMDKIVGEITTHVEKLNISDNTMIIFTGDNGTDKPVVSRMGDLSIAGAKNRTTDAGTRVPLVVKWPGKILSGQVIPDLVDFTDFLPTLCDVAGLTIPIGNDLDGQSFWTRLQGLPGSPRDWVYCWFSRNGVDSVAQVFARNKTHKLYASGAFYDVSNDPLEENPLDTDLSNSVLNVRSNLDSVIKSYAGRRLELID